MIKVNFTKADIERHIKKQLEKIEKETINRLIALGEQCVTMSRDSLNINPAAFPVKYVRNGKPLRQRRISQRDLDKNPMSKEPKFGDYIDQTANLRNSIGYVIVKDGKVIRNHLGSYGKQKSNALVQESAAKVPKGHGLIVVAGMEYAAAVEAKGLNVISSAELFAKSQAQKIREALKKSLK